MAYQARPQCSNPIKGVLNQALIIQLAKINADRGRLGGLLKLWLSNDEKLR
jgi:hypothetical protein